MGGIALGWEEGEEEEGYEEGGFPGAWDGQRLGALAKRYVPGHRFAQTALRAAELLRGTGDGERGASDLS